MELLFCSLCHQSVPLPDLTTGKARRAGERVACAACNQLLDARAAGGEGPTAQALERTRRRSTLVLSTVLASTALLTTVVAAGLLLLRLEEQADRSERERAALSQQLDQLEKRSFGLERLAARLVQEQVEALRADVREVARVPDERLREAALAELDSARQSFVHELEQALQQNGGSPASTPEAPALESFTSDIDERLAWLEDQLSDLRLRRDLPPEAAARDTGLPRLPYPGADDPARAEVLAGLTHENPARRAGALFAIAAEGNRAAVRDVLPLLQDKHPYVRETAARLLERLDARVAVQSLIAVLDDEHVNVREAAVTALRGITGKAFGYDPRADTVERARAVTEWKAWWRDAWRGFLYGEGAVEGE